MECAPADTPQGTTPPVPTPPYEEVLRAGVAAFQAQEPPGLVIDWKEARDGRTKEGPGAAAAVAG